MRSQTRWLSTALACSMLMQACALPGEEGMEELDLLDSTQQALNRSTEESAEQALSRLGIKDSDVRVVRQSGDEIELEISAQDPRKSLGNNAELRDALLQKLNGGRTVAELALEDANRRAAVVAKHELALSALEQAEEGAFLVAIPEPATTQKLGTKIATSRSGGTTALPQGPDDIKYGGGFEYLVRYACCGSLPVLSTTAQGAGVVDTLTRGEKVHVLDVFPKAGLNTALSYADDDTILSDLLDPKERPYFAKVRVPANGKEGYVPLYSLLLSAPKFENGDLQVDLGYGLIARLFNRGKGSFKGWHGMFNPSGCDEVDVKDSTPATEDMYVGGTGDPVPCSGPDAPYDCQVCGDINGAYKDFTCADPEGGNGEINHANCVKYCNYAIAKKGEPIYTNNEDDYACGEYPIGRTHWTGLPEFDRKKVFGTALWNRHVGVEMRRLDGQNASDFDIHNLSTGSEQHIESDKAVTSEKIWLAFEPQNATAGNPSGALDFHLCAFMPGAEFIADNVTFDPKDTPQNAIKRINFGRLDIGQVEMCMTGRVDLDDQWRPQVTWTDVTHLDLKSLSLDKLKITLSAAGIAQLVAVGLLTAAISPALHAIYTSLLTGALLVPALVNALDEGAIVNGLASVIGEAAITGFIVDRVQDVTDKSVNAAVPNFKTMAQTACAAACPASASNPGSPFYPLCEKCNAFASQDAPVRFFRDPGSDDSGCYDLNAMFTPHNKFEAGGGPWWHKYSGHGWADGSYEDDEGCRIGFRMTTTMERYAWETLMCAVNQLNQMTNNDIAVSTQSLRDRMTTYCQASGREMLRHYFGTGQDFQQMLEEDGPGSVMLQTTTATFNPDLLETIVAK